jgi:hypothetical protein
MIFVEIPMKRNITITLEEELAKEARVLAAQKDTSVSQLLAGYLKTVIRSEGDRLKAKRDFFKLTRKKHLLNYSKRTFRREDLHER